MKPIIIIDGWEYGILDDITIPARNGFNFCSGMDIHREPGVLQVSQRLDSMSVDTKINGGFNYVVKPSSGTIGSGTIYGANSDGTLYGCDGTTWYKEHSLAASGKGLAEFNNKLYYASSSYLGSYGGSTQSGDNWNDTYKTLGNGVAADGDTSWHPMVVYGNTLYIGDGKYIASLDNAGVFIGNALTLPSSVRVKCLTVYNNMLVIGTWKQRAGGNITDVPEAILYTWDGFSSLPEEEFILKEPGIHSMANWKNLLIIFAGLSGNVYAFNGATLEKIKTVPKINSQVGQWAVVNPSATCEYGGNLLFGISQGQNSLADYTGIYSLGRKKESLPLALTSPNIISSGTTLGTQIYSLFQGGINTFFVSHVGAAPFDYRMDSINTSNRIATGAYWESQIYDISTEENKTQIKAIEVIAKPLASGNSIGIKYKKDGNSSWSSFGTITSVNQGQPLFGNIGLAKTFQVGLDFIATTSSPQVLAVKVY